MSCIDFMQLKTAVRPRSRCCLITLSQAKAHTRFVGVYLHGRFCRSGQNLTHQPQK
ncbi:MAG: hypothetical protein HC804_09620 [Anaerolineae bacterium]|nr:hypothetical protein [Anaerolineae bacterium]